MPALPQRNFRRVKLINLVEGGDDLIDIPKIHNINSIMVILSGSLVVAAAAATSVPAHSPGGLIDRITFLANGKNTLDNVPFSFSAFGNYQRDFDTEVTAPGTAVATHPFRLVAMLDRVNFDGPRPKDSAFNARINDLLQMRLDYGTVDDIVTKGGATVSLSNVNVEILIDSTEERSDQANEAKVIKVRSLQTITVAGANNNLRINVPRGNHARLIGLLALDAGEPNDALINNVKFVINGVDTRIDAGYDALRSLNRRKVQASIPAGFAILDSSPEGKVSEFWDLRNAGEAEIVIDHNAPVGAGVIQIVTEEMALPRG